MNLHSISNSHFAYILCASVFCEAVFLCRLCALCGRVCAADARARTRGSPSQLFASCSPCRSALRPVVARVGATANNPPTGRADLRCCTRAGARSEDSEGLSRHAGPGACALKEAWDTRHHQCLERRAEVKRMVGVEMTRGRNTSGQGSEYPCPGDVRDRMAAIAMAAAADPRFGRAYVIWI